MHKSVSKQGGHFDTLGVEEDKIRTHFNQSSRTKDTVQCSVMDLVLGWHMLAQLVVASKRSSFFLDNKIQKFDTCCGIFGGTGWRVDEQRNCDFKRQSGDDRLHIAGGVELIERCQHLTIKVHCSGTAHDRRRKDKRIGMDYYHEAEIGDLTERTTHRGADVHHELKVYLLEAIQRCKIQFLPDRTKST